MTENASFDLIKKLGVCLKTKMAEMCLKSVKIYFCAKNHFWFFNTFCVDYLFLRHSMSHFTTNSHVRYFCSTCAELVTGR